MTSRILIVDDSTTIRATVRSFLKTMPIELDMAEDGYSGLTALHARKPDLILVDVLMPRLTGYQFCALAKSNPEYDQVPVFMLTSKDSVVDRARAQLAGAKGFFVKPFRKEQLFDLLRSQGLLNS